MEGLLAQVLDQDARFGVQRSARGVSNTLYMRRRGQLLHEALGKSKEPSEARLHYLAVRGHLLVRRYGPPGPRKADSVRQSLEIGRPSMEDPAAGSSNVRRQVVEPPKGAVKAQPLQTGGSVQSLADHYSFSGMHCLFDHHKAPVTDVRFAPSDPELLAFGSLDGTITIARVGARPTVLHILEGHRAGITGLAWAITNSMLVSVSLDRTLRLWDVGGGNSMKTVATHMDLLACALCPPNNNMLLVGTGQGQLHVYNISVGKQVPGNRVAAAGPIKAVVFDDQGTMVWAGDGKGMVHSFRFDIGGGRLTPLVRVIVAEGHAVTSLACSSGSVLGPKQGPLLLLNCRNNTLYLLSVVDGKGVVRQKRAYAVKHASMDLHSAFAPPTSHGTYPCVVTGSEDGVVLLLDISARRQAGLSKVVVNQLHGHGAAVLAVGWNSSETLLVSADASGHVICWLRTGRLPRRPPTRGHAP